MPAPTPDTFSTLPTELRLKILNYLVPNNTNIFFDFAVGTSRKDGRSIVLSLLKEREPRWDSISALLLLNRQITEEVHHLYYRTNTFILSLRLEIEEVHNAYLDELRKDSNVDLLRCQDLSLTQFLPVEWSLSKAFGPSVKCVRIVVGSLLWEEVRTYKATREYVELFVQACNVGGAEKSLESLRVEYADEMVQEDFYFDQDDALNVRKPLKNTPYVMEPLVELGGVPTCEVVGLPAEDGFEEFGQKLAGVLREGMGSEMVKKEYEDVTYFREAGVGHGKRQKMSRTTKQYYDSEYDWDLIELESDVEGDDSEDEHYEDEGDEAELVKA